MAGAPPPYVSTERKAPMKGTDWLMVGMAVFIACCGLSFIVKAWRGEADCPCEDHDLDEIESELDRLSSAIAEIRLQMQPETARRIDEFLNDPSTGVRAVRPGTELL